ncbi:MAG: META domain-containing protein [Nitrospiraceae bacterium]|nr:MAG: META domain-containing protein [Nitrospiraceae bacterium]
MNGFTTTSLTSVVIAWTVLFLAACPLPAHSTSLEDARWQLVEADGSPVAPLPGERQPSMTFDAGKKQATGFAGCNTFFGSYELDGSSLTFGPVGATRMFCEGAAGEVEMKFMQALEQTRTWEVRDCSLLLLKNGEVLARFTMVRADDPAVDLQSMTFISTWFPSGSVTLSRGEYRAPAAPGSASETVVKLSDKRAFGTMEGKETGAVVLVTDPGGSGTFYDLALLIKEEHGWVNTDVVQLGDRVKVNSIEIRDDATVISMKTHGPGDPMCCPTLWTEKRFTVQGNRFVPFAGGPEEKNAGEITGTVWQWVQTLYNNDTKAVPVDPRNYTVQFLEDSTLTVKADCNQKGGTYSIKDKSLSIEITHSSMAACPEGSLEDEFVRGLSGAAIYFLGNGDLYIDLKYDTGTMRFSK